MQARRLLGNKYIIDVNVYAIYLVENHPGNPYVTPLIDKGLRGEYILGTLDVVPLRALWIMIHKWRISKDEAYSCVKNFVEMYPTIHYIPITRNTILKAFKLSKDLKHDVFDCTYLAAALDWNANGIITTDTDFKKLCSQLNLEYINPIPKEILRKFSWRRFS